ncbi:MAG: OB-fold domain-containing protein [Candidatus Binatia bacterium]
MERPLPQIDPDTAGFWRAAGERRLVIQYCPVTGAYQHPPQPFMAGCGFDWEWREVPGTGTVYSFTIVHPPAHPAFATPYAAAVVDLDEARVRIVGQVRGIAPDAVTIGMRVRVAFEVVGEIGIPYFVPL